MSFDSNQNQTPPTPELPPSFETNRPPPLILLLADLFLRPSRFFVSQLPLRRAPYLPLVAWIYGMASVIDRIEQEMLRLEVGEASAGWATMGSYITETWTGFWSVVLVAGAAAAVPLWFVGGWWYRLRLSWCGVSDWEPHLELSGGLPRGPSNRDLAQRLFIYSSFVYAGPMILAGVLESVAYPNYQAVYDSPADVSLILLILPFWAVFVSYRGIRALFSASLAKTRIWFLILPTLIYSVVWLAIVLIGLTFLLSMPPDVENPERFSGEPISFSYPGNWDLDPESNGSAVFVDSFQGVSVSFLYYRSGSSLEEEILAAVKRHESEVRARCNPRGDFGEYGGFRGAGHELICRDAYDDDPYQLRVFVTRIEDFVLKATETCPLDYTEEASPGLELVRSSLEVH